ncbi:Uncharacterised protein [Actinobaculum suis]|uniref:LytR/CpsA/Psr regulator C-terminal domain-containing protein n=1 Tax=Actinobaculum suis TaxID=1657 RepID=A0A7Z8Y895_9ACTO|nr:LytR C-terminal domain-containing protein [Actinobaculum suis]VDG75748.1 Uncharacterised protein [Actinobaculum suis]
MAKKYPEDEFDIAARQRVTQGAHRKQKSNAKWWIALVAVLILAPLVGIGLIKLNNVNVDSLVKESPTPAVVETATPEPDPSASLPVYGEGEQPGESPIPEPGQPVKPGANGAEDGTEANADAAEAEPAENPTPQADTSKSISLLNASGINGYAAKNQNLLLEAGYTNVAIGNYRHAAPAHSQIFYPAAADLPTVQAIGAALGITDFVENAQATGGNQIVVVLVD